MVVGKTSPTQEMNQVLVHRIDRMLIIRKINRGKAQVKIKPNQEKAAVRIKANRGKALVRIKVNPEKAAVKIKVSQGKALQKIKVQAVEARLNNNWIEHRKAGLEELRTTIDRILKDQVVEVARVAEEEDVN